MSEANVMETVKRFVLETFLPGEDSSLLAEDTPLISGGILDSISTVKLVTFLEQQYGIEFQAHEISSDNLETLVLIAQIVQTKCDAKA
jgi:acyl carrier protein